MKQLILFFALTAPAFGQYTIGQWTAATAGTGGSTAATPTFSPAAGAVSNPTTVTASTSTSGCGSYIYFDTNPTPTTNQATYSVTSGVTLYAYVHGCPGYADSSVGSAVYTISAGSITHVSTSTCGNQTISSNATSCTLTKTVTSGNFIACFIAGDASTTLVSAKANPGSVSMAQAFTYSAGRDKIGVWFVPNSGAYTSISVSYSGSNGSTSTTDCEEYSGLSATAAVVNTAVTGDSGFTYTTSWDTGVYTATTSNLLMAGSTFSYNSGTWGAGSGWALRGHDSSSGTSTNLMVEDQLGPTAGSYTGVGTNSAGPNYGYYTYWIVSFK